MWLVILGHISSNEYIVRTIYSFHMPLFFVLSGILYKPNSDQRYFFKKKFLALIIPYCIFYILSLLYFWCVEFSFRDLAIESEWKRLIPLIYGADLKGLMSHNIALWFLPALFTTEIIGNCINTKISNPFYRTTTVILISMLGIVLSFENIWNLPWGLSQALVMMVFFYIGIWLRPFINLHIRKKFLIVLLVICFIIFAINIPFSNRIDIASGNFSNILSFITNACFGLSIVILFALLLNQSKILEYFGKGDITLCALAFQGIVYRPLIFIDSKLIGLNGGGEHIHAIIISLLTYAICGIISYFYIKMQRKIFVIFK